MFVTGVLSNGGAERVISVLAKELCEYGYEVDIITIYGDQNDYIHDKKIHIYPIRHRFKNRALRAMRNYSRNAKTNKKKKSQYHYFICS